MSNNAVLNCRPGTELVEIYSVHSPDNAQIVSATLNSAGIPCWVSSGDSSHEFGIGLFVRSNDVQRAWTVFETFNQCS
jgi:hypothetical protein